MTSKPSRFQQLRSGDTHVGIVVGVPGVVEENDLATAGEFLFAPVKPGGKTAPRQSAAIADAD